LSVKNSRYAPLSGPVDGFVGPFECQRRESLNIGGLRAPGKSTLIVRNDHRNLRRKCFLLHDFHAFGQWFSGSNRSQVATDRGQKVVGNSGGGRGAHKLCSYVMFRILGKCKKNPHTEKAATQIQTHFYDEPLSSHYIGGIGGGGSGVRTW